MVNLTVGWGILLQGWLVTLLDSDELAPIPNSNPDRPVRISTIRLLIDGWSPVYRSRLFLLFYLQVSGTLSGTTGGEDGGGWLDDADILLVAAERFVHKLKQEGGIGAHAPRYSFAETELLQLSFGRAEWNGRGGS